MLFDMKYSIDRSIDASVGSVACFVRCSNQSIQSVTPGMILPSNTQLHGRPSQQQEGEAVVNPHSYATLRSPAAAMMLGRGRGGRGGGRFGGRLGMLSGGATALDHLREAAEEMGLDPRAAAGGQQQEPSPQYPFVPLFPPRPLTEAEGEKIQAQRELGAWVGWVHVCVCGNWVCVGGVPRCLLSASDSSLWP